MDKYQVAHRALSMYMCKVSIDGGHHMILVIDVRQWEGQCVFTEEWRVCAGVCINLVNLGL